jgi:hypothetical protein
LASDSARAVGAVAYTVGQHLVFRDEAFSPQSEQGRRLLAHELTHVAQQSPVLARAVEGEALEPAGFGGTEPASVQCDSEDNEGFPLLMRGAKRNAVGFAQKRLNAHLEQIILCLRGPCPSIPDLNKEFIQIQLTKLTEFPLNVDCKFGPNTEAVTKILQARWLRRAIEWDGKIGPTTWDLILLDPVTHTHPAPPPPSPPPPFSFPPLPPVPQPSKPFPI